jgi:hypothetical protein
MQLVKDFLLLLFKKEVLPSVTSINGRSEPVARVAQGISRKLS